MDLTDAQKSVVIYLKTLDFTTKIALEIIKQLEIKNKHDFLKLTDEQIDGLLPPIYLIHKRLFKQALQESSPGLSFNMNVNPYYVHTK